MAEKQQVQESPLDPKAQRTYNVPELDLRANPSKPPAKHPDDYPPLKARLADREAGARGSSGHVDRSSDAAPEVLREGPPRQCLLCRRRPVQGKKKQEPFMTDVVVCFGHLQVMGRWARPPRPPCLWVRTWGPEPLPVASQREILRLKRFNYTSPLAQGPEHNLSTELRSARLATFAVFRTKASHFAEDVFTKYNAQGVLS